MKAIKMFGLAALAALLAMAFVGTGSAMAEATSLCHEEAERCKAVTHVHEATLAGAKGVLLSEPEVECDVLFLGDTLGEAGAPLIIHGNFTYSNCEGGCTASEENGPTEIKVLAEGSELSSVISGTGSGAGLVHLVCFGFINCRYVGSGLVGHGLGALTSSETNGSVSLSEQTVAKESGSLCPATGELDITTTPLEATYIGGEEGEGESAAGMVCIFVGTNNGGFSSFENSEKCTGPVSKESGSYELGTASNTEKGAEVCAFVGEGNGLYLWRIFGSCWNNDGKPRKGKYEDGTVA